MANHSPYSVPAPTPAPAQPDPQDAQQPIIAEPVSSMKSPSQLESLTIPGQAEGNDHDSTLGDDTPSFAASLRSSVLDFKEEYGRRYHSFREGRYFMPNDENEQDRLDILHAMMVQLMDGKLVWAPIGSSPGRVLDIGTGTGIWAIDFAEQNPTAEVTGNDLSPTQPAWVPPNLNFIVDDIEDEWGYENAKFDYVHARNLAGAIRNWPRLIGQAFGNIKPGGWLEFQEWDYRYACADGSVSRDSGIWSFHTHVCGRLEAAGFDASPGAGLEKWFRDVGFVNVQEHRLPIPLGTWAKDKKLKRIGAFNRMQFDEGLEAIAIGCMTRAAANERAWSMDEVQVLVADARRDLKNPKFHGHYNL